MRVSLSFYLRAIRSLQGHQGQFTTYSLFTIITVKEVTFGFDTELLHSYLRWELSPQALESLVRSLTF